MELAQMLQAMSALAGVVMILMGSAWLKQYLKGIAAK